MEFCLIYYHGPNDRLEMTPMPKDQSILSIKTNGDNLIKAFNYLGTRGWQLGKKHFSSQGKILNNFSR